MFSVSHGQLGNQDWSPAYLDETISIQNFVNCEELQKHRLCAGLSEHSSSNTAPVTFSIFLYCMSLP